MSECKVIQGDCLEVLRGMEDNSVDSVVCDPPYGLSNTKPAQVADVLAAWVTGDTEAVPATKGGFMGKDWDSFVPPPAVWAECLRVLKPGGHMAVFAGARTQDLMGLSIRLAGFEIRDTLGWVYGSGFPKSMDISKAIDKGQALTTGRAREFTEWMRSTGVTARQIDEATGTQTGSHYTTHPTQPAIATADLFDKLRPLLPEVPERIERLVAERTGIEWTDYVKREVVGSREVPKGHAFAGSTYGGDSSNKSVDVTSAHTDAAKQWSGWGTALKPAIEPIILARKPLEGTVAANVLAHGVGGLNIDASRVGMSDADREAAKVPMGDWSRSGTTGATDSRNGATVEPAPAGRFPANVLLDEHAAKEMDRQSGHLSPGARPGNTATRPKFNGATYNSGKVYDGKMDEPRTAMDSGGGASRFFPVFKSEEPTPGSKGRFPANVLLDEYAAKEMDEQSGVRQAGGYPASKGVKSSPGANGTMGGGWAGEYREHRETTLPGGASRFFPVFKYQAKAPKRERPVIVREDGTKVQHPTVKPLALMEWLVTLITPEGGTVLDPFAGTGTTLQAARDKGFRAIGIEQDPDYIQLINARLETAAADGGLF